MLTGFVLLSHASRWKAVQIMQVFLFFLRTTKHTLIDLRLYLDRLHRGDSFYYMLEEEYGTGKVPPEYLDDKADLWGL